MRVNLKRTLNWTDRVKIPRGAVHINVQPTDAAPEVLVVTFGLNGLNVPHPKEEWDESLVVLEASRHTTSSFERIEIGSLHEVVLRKPIQYRGMLSSFLGSEDISFTIKIISRRDGRLLAEGKNLHAGDEPAEREELLPVRRVDLGQETWRVAWEVSGPILQINSRLQDAEEFSRKDTSKALISHAAFRAVLMRLAMDEDAREESWAEPWRFFIAKLGGPEVPPADEDWDAYDDWVNTLVSAFCTRHALTDRINDQLAPGGDA